MTWVEALAALIEFRQVGIEVKPICQAKRTFRSASLSLFGIIQSQPTSGSTPRLAMSACRCASPSTAIGDHRR
jgi:hypothetical protein